MSASKCAVCGQNRAPSDLLRFSSTRTILDSANGMVFERDGDDGFVCRPDRWLDDGDRAGFVREKRYDRNKRREVPLRSDPCFSEITTQRVSPNWTVPPYQPDFASYPIRPGTEDWDRLMDKSGGWKALRQSSTEEAA